MLLLDAGARVNAKTATREEEALEPKYHRTVSIAFDKARAVVEAPAHTLE
jgi:hypothetical protein